VPPDLEQFTQDGTRHSWTGCGGVERMMAGDYAYVAPTGQAQDREAILRIIPVARLIGCIAGTGQILSSGCWATTRRHPLSRQGEGDFRRQHFQGRSSPKMQVCARIRGEWKVVTEQATANKP